MVTVLTQLVIALLVVECISNGQNPHIVIILVDDLGINDVSFHGSDQILTPNIDALAYNGVILNRLYTPNLCTPSRASLLTGRYPIHTGTQHSAISNDEPWGLPLNERTMPEIFREEGYSTNLIGKWHLGFAKKEYTPNFRGFDYHVGYYSGYISYYEHDLIMLNRNYSRGYDFRKNLDVSYEGKGVYATDLLTDEAIKVIKQHETTKPLFLMMSHLGVHTGNEDDPLEAPLEDVIKFTHIRDPQRKIYAAMVSRIDMSVGKLIKALADKNILNNSIVVFYSDNGAPTVGLYANSGSNYPFKGQKESPWEGGLRSPAFIWSPLLKQKGMIYNQILHSIDWLPTLASAANVKLPSNLQLDGVDMWHNLNNNELLINRQILHVLDDVHGYSSIMRNNFKYVNGTEAFPQAATWLGSIEQTPDPRTDQYMDLVLESVVSQSIQNSDLRKSDIINLRNQAIYHCNIRENVPPNSGYYNCNPAKAPCLFDIEQDPCEMYNLAIEHPDIVNQFEIEVENYRNSAVQPANKPPDPRADPRWYNNTWTWWLQEGRNCSSNAMSLSNKSFLGLVLLGLGNCCYI